VVATYSIPRYTGDAVMYGGTRAFLETATFARLTRDKRGNCKLVLIRMELTQRTVLKAVINYSWT